MPKVDFDKKSFEEKGLGRFFSKTTDSSSIIKEEEKSFVKTRELILADKKESKELKTPRPSSGKKSSKKKKVARTS